MGGKQIFVLVVLGSIVVLTIYLRFTGQGTLPEEETGAIQAEVEEVIVSSDDSSGRMVILNHGGEMEGHTPIGFRGSGTGLFAGDNLNHNFPDGDGVQIFLTFDLESLSTSTIESAILTSAHAHVSGDPYEGLGTLQAREIRYDSFSPDLWNTQPFSTFACVFATSTHGPFLCDVTSVLENSRMDGYRYAQFQLRFDRAGDRDGTQDLASFFITNSNTNESGIFELQISFLDGSETFLEDSSL